MFGVLRPDRAAFARGVERVVYTQGGDEEPGKEGHEAVGE